MTGKELKAKLRRADVASESCRWVRIPPGTILAKVAAEQGMPLGHWAVTLPRGTGMKAIASRILAAEGIDAGEIQFLASADDFSAEERALIDAGGTVDGWSGST
jgi:hypothetical protein